MVIYGGSDDVALVLDDGPNPKVTPKILELLDNKGVKANFFLIGKKTEESPDLARQIANAGHEIGNHSYTHKRLGRMLQDEGKEAVLDEIHKSAKAIKSITDINALFFRPPYLDWSEAVGELARPLYGDRIIMAGTKSGDYSWGIDHIWDESDMESIKAQASRIIADWVNASPGTIIGLHDSAEYNLPGNAFYENWMNRALPTLEALPTVIDNFHQNGFAFKKLSEMDLMPIPLITQ